MLVILTPESDLLSSMSHVDQLVFQCLAMSTDYESGFIGRSKPVSKAYISGAVSENVRGRAKRSWVLTSEKDVENSIKRLVDVGLFERHSTRSNLVLKRVIWVELMSLDSSVQNEVRYKLGAKLGANVKKLSFIFSRLKDSLLLSEGGNSSEVRGCQDIYINKSVDEKRFLMPLDYEFDRPLLKTIIRNSGVDPALVKPEWCGLVVNYFNQNKTMCTFDEFHHRCAKQLCYWVKYPPESFVQAPHFKKSRSKSNVSSFVPAVNRPDFKSVVKPEHKPADPQMVNDMMDDMFKSLGVKRR